MIEQKSSSIEWDSSKHSVAIDGEIIQLTKTEFRLLYLLRHGTPISYDKLASEIYSCTTNHKTRIMLDKHIDRIRGKTRKTAISIHCVISYGYVLLFDAKYKPQGATIAKERGE